MTSVRRRRLRPVLLLLPCFWPLLAFQIASATAKATRDLGRSAKKGTKKRISRVRRRRTNKRAATHDVATRSPMPNVTERNHLESGLLKLPVELRQQIYDLHLKQATILIQELSDRKGHYRLSSAMRRPFAVLVNGRRPHPHSRVVRNPSQLMHLLLVCRQIYCETIEYIYRRNTFRFVHHEPAFLLPTLSIFPQKHLDTLRSLEFQFCIDILVKDLGLEKCQPGPYYERTPTSWTASLGGRSRQQQRWAALWTFLATLPNLQRLHVAFTRLPGPDNLTDDWVFWSILAPLLQFNKRERLAMFEVEWQRKIKDWGIPDGWTNAIPFQVVWSPGGIDQRR